MNIDPRPPFRLLRDKFRARLPWISRFYQSVRDPVAAVGEIAEEIRVSVIVSLLLAVSFHVPQSVEAFAVLGEDLAEWKRGPLVFGLALVFACLILWFSGRVVLYLTHPGQYVSRGARGFAVRNLPWLTATLPWLSACLACYDVSRHVPRLGGEMWFLTWSGLLVLAAVAFFNGFDWWVARRLGQPLRPPPQLDKLVMAAADLVWWMLFFGVVFFVVCVAFGQRTTLLGPLAVCCIGAAFWCTIGSILAWYGQSIRFPVLNAALLAVLLFSQLDWNDNHFVRELPPAAPAPAEQPLADVFHDWLAQRPDRQDYQDVNVPYPVFVVSAQGGGVYAMQFTALMLAELQARDPRFVDHVFAISGVSGGSVGATVFAALARERAAGNAPRYFPASTERVLANDFLSPVIASALFPDLVQQALFFRLPFGDRATALEGAFEAAWANERQSAVLAEPFYALGEDFARRSVPLLLLNTTQVETGRRVVISSVPLSGWSVSAGTFLHRLKPEAILRASTAAGLSARFPYVTPVGSMNVRAPAGAAAPESWKIRLADGGYFDNSGTSTLRDLTRALTQAGGGGVRFRLIAITLGTTDESTRDFDGRHDSGFGLGEILSPIRTMLNTRPARSVMARTNLQEDVPAGDRTGRLVRVYSFSLDVDRDSIPLGWLLSNTGRTAIAAQIAEKWTRQTADPALDADPRELLQELKPRAAAVRALPARLPVRAKN